MFLISFIIVNGLGSMLYALIIAKIALTSKRYVCVPNLIFVSVGLILQFILINFVSDPNTNSIWQNALLTVGVPSLVGGFTSCMIIMLDYSDNRKA